MSARTIREIVPLLRETAWLFDSELLALARRRGFVIRELAVDWIEHRDGRRQSTLHVWKDGWGFIYGVWRIRRRVHKLSTVTS